MRRTSPLIQASSPRESARVEGGERHVPLHVHCSSFRLKRVSLYFLFRLKCVHTFMICSCVLYAFLI
jgi:hypothetical protein